MAWEEESIEGGADFEEVGGKKSPLKLIIIIVVALALAAGGFMAYKKFFDKPPEEEENSEKPVEEEVVEEDATGFPVSLDKFTLNLSETGSTERFLVTTISLEVSTEELKLALDDEEDKKLYKIKTRDAILKILREQTYEDIKDPDTTKHIADKIKVKLSRIYKKDGEVIGVYFLEHLVQ